MFIGHYSIAFAAAAHQDAPKLGTLFVAAQLVDIGFFVLVLTGGEAMRVTPGITVMNPLDLYHMPYTHSLIGTLLWATAFLALLRLLGASWRAGLIGALVVLSHWGLDLLVHGPDLTIFGAPPKFGLGLWNYPLIEMPLELGLTGGAYWLYLRATTSQDRSPAVPLLALFLLGVQLFNWFAPQPAAFDNSIPLSALIAYGMAIWLASRVARGRIHKGGG